MKNAMQLKAIIKNLAKEKHISAQLVMQNFMLESIVALWIRSGIARLCRNSGRTIRRILSTQRTLHLRKRVMWCGRVDG